MGNSAQQQALIHPSNVIFQAKRFIGRPYVPLSETDASRFPFSIINSSGMYAFSIPSLPVSDSAKGTGSQRPEAARSLFSLSAFARAGTTASVVSPEDVGAVILSTLRSTASKRLGVDVRKVVLAVPADFSAAQRNATQRAGELAGMEVVRIINEPTAAALAYGMHKKVCVCMYACGKKEKEGERRIIILKKRYI